MPLILLFLKIKIFCQLVITSIWRILQYGGRHWGIIEKLLNWLLHFRESLIHISYKNSLILQCQHFGTCEVDIEGADGEAKPRQKMVILQIRGLEAKYNLLTAVWLFQFIILVFMIRLEAKFLEEVFCCLLENFDVLRSLERLILILKQSVVKHNASFNFLVCFINILYSEIK